MQFLGVYPAPNLLEESWREVARERRQQQRIKEARDARRAMRPSRFAALRRSYGQRSSQSLPFRRRRLLARASPGRGPDLATDDRKTVKQMEKLAKRPCRPGLGAG